MPTMIVHVKLDAVCEVDDVDLDHLFARVGSKVTNTIGPALRNSHVKVERLDRTCTKCGIPLDAHVGECRVCGTKPPRTTNDWRKALTTKNSRIRRVA